MLDFIKRLNKEKMIDLAISTTDMDYHDYHTEKKLVFYELNNEYLLLEIHDNYINFKDSEGDKLYKITDFTISRDGSNQNFEYGFYEFMTLEFGDEWYDKAKTYLISQNDLTKLKILEKAKEEADKMLADDPLPDLLNL